MILHCTCRICQGAFDVTVDDELMAGLQHQAGNMRPNVCSSCDQPDKPLSRSDRDTAVAFRDGPTKSKTKAIVNWTALAKAQRKPGATDHLTSSQLYAITRLTKMLDIVQRRNDQACPDLPVRHPEGIT